MENISSQNTFYFDGQERPISFPDTIKLDGYTIRPFVFMDKAKEEASGAFFELEPYAHTTVVKVTTPEVHLLENVYKGSGWFLATNGITSHKMSLRESGNGLDYGTGTTFSFFAGPKGLVIANITLPPFCPDMETVVAINSPDAPEYFWELYHQSLGYSKRRLKLSYLNPDREIVGADK